MELPSGCFVAGFFATSLFETYLFDWYDHILLEGRSGEPALGKGVGF